MGTPNTELKHLSESQDRDFPTDRKNTMENENLKRNDNINVFILGHNHLDNELQRILMEKMALLKEEKIPVLFCFEIQFSLNRFIQALEDSIKNTKEDLQRILLVKKKIESLDSMSPKLQEYDLNREFYQLKCASLKSILNMLKFIQKEKIPFIPIDTAHKDGEIQKNNFEYEIARIKAMTSQIMGGIQSLQASGGVIFALVGTNHSHRLSAYLHQSLQSQPKEKNVLTKIIPARIFFKKTQLLKHDAVKWKINYDKEVAQDEPFVKELYKKIPCTDLEYSINSVTKEYYLPGLDQLFETHLYRECPFKPLSKEAVYLKDLQSMIGCGPNNEKIIRIDENTHTAYFPITWLRQVKSVNPGGIKELSEKAGFVASSGAIGQLRHFMWRNS